MQPGDKGHSPVHSWRDVIYSGLLSAPAYTLLRAATPSDCIAVLMYHELGRDDSDIDAWTVVREGDFVRQLNFLKQHCDILTLDQALSQMQSSEVSPRPRVVITFDDGSRGNAVVLLPIIEALKVPVTIYIATRQIEEAQSYWFDRIINALQLDREVTIDLRSHGLGRYQLNRIRGKGNWHLMNCLLEDLKSLSPSARESAVEEILRDLPSAPSERYAKIEPLSVSQVKALSSCPYVTIGAHSHCHNILAQLDAAEAERSITLSKRLLERWSGRAVEHFAYPDGCCDESVKTIVRRAGFRSAVTGEPMLWRTGTSLLEIPRIGVGRYDSLNRFKFNLLARALGQSLRRRYAP